MINFQTGVTTLQMSLRTESPFLYRMGWDPIDVDLDERGSWDLRVGTLNIESGTVALVGGPLTGLTLPIRSGAKNQKRTVSTGNKTGGWQGVDVEILDYGSKPGEDLLLDAVQSLSRRISKKGASIAHVMSQAISVTNRRSVFITYACVVTETFQDQEMKEGEWINVGNPYTKSTVTDAIRRELQDFDAQLWWQGKNPAEAEFQNALARNIPRGPCP
jgi:hypothetical protein